MIRFHRNVQFRTAKGFIGRRALRLVSVIAVLFALMGCAAVAKNESVPAFVKSEMDAVAINATVIPEAIQVWRPRATAAAREGAKTAVEVANTLTGGLWPIFYYGVGTIAVPSFGAAIGYLTGLVKEPPSKEVDKIQSALRAIVDETRIPEHLLETIRGNLDETAPHVRLLTLNSAEQRRSDVVDLKNQGIKSVLELEVTEVEVAGPWGSDPAGTISMTVASRIVRVADGSLLFSRAFEFKDKYELHDWYEQQADGDKSRALQWILVRAADSIGRKIAGMFHTEQNSAGAEQKANLN
jgi:hypothetical protein